MKKQNIKEDSHCCACEYFKDGGMQCGEHREVSVFCEEHKDLTLADVLKIIKEQNADL